MKFSDRMTRQDAMEFIRKTTDRNCAVSTDFGVACISNKEALHLLETCELEVVCLSYSPGLIALEYPED